MKRILQNRSLMIIATSQVVSGIGNWITMLSVLALLVFYGGGGVVQTSWIMLAGFVPMILCSPLAGMLCDRFDRKWLMMGSEFCSGLAVLGIVLSPRVEIIYALLVAQSVSGSLLGPASQSALPTLVARDDLTQANAFLQQLASMIKIAAPFLAGFLLTLFRPQQAMIPDVISFALSVLTLSFLPALPPEKAPGQKVQTEEHQKQPAQTPITAIGAIRSSPQLQLLFVIAFFLILIVGNFDILGPVFLRDVLHQSVSIYGLLIGLVGAGMVAGSLSLLVRKGEHDRWRDVVISMFYLTTFPATFVASFWLHLPIIALTLLSVGCLLGGFGQGMLFVQAETLLQLLTPPHVLGRLSGLFQSTFAVAQLLTLLTIPLLVPTVLSFGLFFTITLVAVVLLTLWTIITLYKSRHRSLIPDPSVVEG